MKGGASKGDEPRERTGRGRRCAGGLQGNGLRRHRTLRTQSRDAILSATRRALATMVSVGFTAPIEGKKLASVT